MDNKSLRKQIRRLARGLSFKMMVALFYHGGAAFMAPFLFFAALAAPAIKPEANAISAVAGVAALWFCTWNYVRVARKRQYQPFCALWLAVLPQGEAAAPEGDNRAEAPSRLAPVHLLFFLRLKAAVFALVPVGILAALRDEEALMLFALPLWYGVEVFLLSRLLRRRIAESPALESLVEQSAALQSAEDSLNKGTPKKMWYFASDFVFWGWIAAPLWLLVVFVGTGYLPHIPDDEVAAFFDAPPPPIPENSGSYALAGLDAPLGTADITGFGRREMESFRAGGVLPDTQPEDLIKGLRDFNHFRICAAQKPKAPPQPPRASNPLPPVFLPDPNAAAPSPNEAASPPNEAAPPPNETSPPPNETSPPPNETSPPPGVALPLPDFSADPLLLRCMYLAEWGPVLEANKEMLARFESLYAYDDFRMPPDLEGRGVYRGQLLMELARMEAVRHVWRAYAGEPEAALKGLLDNVRFARKMVETPATIVSFAISLTIYGLSLNALPYILGRQPDLAAKYRDEIGQVLLFLDYAGFDYKKIWDADARAQPALMEKITALEPEGNDLLRLINRALMGVLLTDVYKAKLYKMTLEVHAALDNRDPPARQSALKRLEAEYSTADNYSRFSELSDLGHLYQSFVANLMLGGAIVGTVLFYADGSATNRARLKLALVDALARGAYPDGMEKFLNEAPARNKLLANVTDGSPFYWSAKDRAVCFDIIVEQAPTPDRRCLDVPDYYTGPE